MLIACFCRKKYLNLYTINLIYINTNMKKIYDYPQLGD